MMIKIVWLDLNILFLCRMKMLEENHLKSVLTSYDVPLLVLETKLYQKI
jgi:hypothetical protein